MEVWDRDDFLLHLNVKTGDQKDKLFIEWRRLNYRDGYYYQKTKLNYKLITMQVILFCFGYMYGDNTKSY